LDNAYWRHALSHVTGTIRHIGADELPWYLRYRVYIFDDIIMTEVIESTVSQTKTAAKKVESWSDANHRTVNIKKTKEVSLPPPLITLHDRCIDRVPSYKLLG
jgi:hypothetical protein